MRCCVTTAVTPRPPLQSTGGTGLSAGALAGIIAAGALVLLLLVIFLFILLMVVNGRRRWASKTTYKSAAHDNPTYMTHRDLNANLAAAGGSPIDLVFDANGAVGVTFYADDEKKKVTFTLLISQISAPSRA